MPTGYSLISDGFFGWLDHETRELVLSGEDVHQFLSSNINTDANRLGGTGEVQVISNALSFERLGEERTKKGFGVPVSAVTYQLFYVLWQGHLASSPD